MTSTSVPYSTAADMARLTRYALNKASFRFYVSQKERQISFQQASRKIELPASEHERTSGRNGIDGVKTDEPRVPAIA